MIWNPSPLDFESNLEDISLARTARLEREQSRLRDIRLGFGEKRIALGGDQSQPHIVKRGRLPRSTLPDHW